MESLLGNTRRPDVSFFRDGRIDITSNVSRMLSLREGDVIDVIKCNRELYIYVKWRNTDVVGNHTARCRKTKPNTACTNFRAFSVKLCALILDICGADNVVRLPAGEQVNVDGVGLAVPLITRINLYKDDKRD